MKKKIWLVISIIAFSCAMVIFVMLGIRHYRNLQAQKLYEEYAQKRQENIHQTAAPESSDVPLEIPVDFKSLKEDNPDIYAWITIPGTEIDYPVVQSSTDNAYYLNHSVDYEESSAGAIFTENYNSRDFSDFLTVLYGHNMKSGAMFAGLRNYEDNSFFETHRDVTIYTPDAIRKYRVFAAYVEDDRHLLYYYNQGQTPEDRRAFLDDAAARRDLQSIYDADVPVDENSRILTLSTCHRMGDHYRFLVHACLVEEIK